ncbi:FAD/NAD(P)-binding domain-containing protein [Rhizodiscina lignyota]|uniref:FAD/NAD(P)-binding domain-containing protein n=1 Tax=Rhizodiscina lignyota TaxID=1504668 RepID=A0A9P4MBX6_9PEZI|nr:FAD/NAD(P)-binding domain-containing protein [Rhizodiscina lignyota]
MGRDGAAYGSILDQRSYKEEDIIRRDVAVIGGGASGTYGAITLGDMGKSVVLVEREKRLGGHENTYTDPVTGTHIDYGVQTYANISVSRDFFARFNIPVTNFTFPAGTTVYADFKSGHVLPRFSPGINFAPYVQQLTKYPDLAWSWNISTPVPKDLLLPFGDFVKKYHLEDLAFSVFSNPQGAANPPFLEQLTVNVLKITDESYLQGLQEGGDLVTANHDNGALYAAAQEELGSNALLSSTVIAAHRPSDDSCVSLVVKTPHGWKLVVASQLLVSIPLTIPNMAPFDLDNDERALFEKFHYSGYYTGIFKNTGLSKGTRYVNIDLDTEYHIPNLPGAYDITPTAVEGIFYYWFGSPKELSQKEIEAEMIATVRRLTNSSDEVPEFVAFASHSPFKLEVSAEDIQDRFYDKLFALQGKRKTWYTGAAVESHNSGELWNFTNALLHRMVDA